ncbi:MAG: hypothetical protein ACRC0R_04810 [Cetobacterium sp.]
MVFEILALGIISFFIYNLGKRILTLEKKIKQNIIEKNNIPIVDTATKNQKCFEISEKKIEELKDSIDKLEVLTTIQNKKIENLEKNLVETQKYFEKKKESLITEIYEKKEVQIESAIKKEIQKVILFDKKENHEKIYFKFIDNLKVVEQFLKKSQDSEAELYSKLIDQYKESLERVNKKINFLKIEENEYSEELTYKFIYVIERDFLRILTSIIKGEKLKNRDFYKVFKNKLEEYIENLGFYKREDLDITEGKVLNENVYTYMELFRVSTEDKNLDKKIKEIELDPYFIKFYDEDGEEKEYATKGKLSVYIVKE